MFIKHCFLQETHFKWSSRVGLSISGFPVWFHGYSPNKRSKGIAIGFDRNTPFILKAMESDFKGRYLFIKGPLFNKEYTFANIYCPNIQPCLFLRKILKKLEHFKEGKVIMAGDFNFVLDPALDTQPISLRSEWKNLKAVKKKLYQQQLIEHGELCILGGGGTLIIILKFIVHIQESIMSSWITSF